MHLCLVLGALTDLGGQVVPRVLCQPRSLLLTLPQAGTASRSVSTQKQLLPEQALLSRVNTVLLNGTMNAQQEGGTRKTLGNRNSPPWHSVPANF